jgi:hypothetical protein
VVSAITFVEVSVIFDVFDVFTDFDFQTAVSVSVIHIQKAVSLSKISHSNRLEPVGFESKALDWKVKVK